LQNLGCLKEITNVFDRELGHAYPRHGRNGETFVDKKLEGFPYRGAADAELSSED
jgi:hypothetical protein